MELFHYYSQFSQNGSYKSFSFVSDSNIFIVDRRNSREFLQIEGIPKEFEINAAFTYGVTLSFLDDFVVVLWDFMRTYISKHFIREAIRKMSPHSQYVACLKGRATWVHPIVDNTHHDYQYVGSRKGAKRIGNEYFCPFSTFKSHTCTQLRLAVPILRGIASKTKIVTKYCMYT